jgi:prefoldin subunit 5
MTANDTRRDIADHDDLRFTLASNREKLVRQRVDLLAQIRALSRQLESIDRQLDHIAHTEAAYTEA